MAATLTDARTSAGPFAAAAGAEEVAAAAVPGRKILEREHRGRREPTARTTRPTSSATRGLMQRRSNNEPATVQAGVLGAGAVPWTRTATRRTRTSTACRPACRAWRPPIKISSRCRPEARSPCTTRGTPTASSQLMAAPTTRPTRRTRHSWATRFLGTWEGENTLVVDVVGFNDVQLARLALVLPHEPPAGYSSGCAARETRSTTRRRWKTPTC